LAGNPIGHGEIPGHFQKNIEISGDVMKGKPTVKDLELETSRLKALNADLNRQLQSSDYIQALLETSDDGIMVSDEKGTPRFFNSAYANAIKEALGIEMTPGIEPSTLLKDPDAILHFQKAKNRALQGERFRMEFRHQYKGGQTRYFEFSFCPVRVGDKIKGYTQISRDITSRVEAQACLKEKENLLNHSERIAGMGSFIWDLKTNEVLWSDNMYRIQGVPEADIKTRPIKINPEIVHPEDRVKAISQINEMIATGKISSLEFRIIPPDGHERKIRWNGEFEKDEHQRPDKFYGIYQDITETSRARDELDERNLFIETVLEKMPIGVAVTRLSTGVSTLINEKFQEIFGWPKEEIPDLRTFFKKVYPDPEYRRKVRKKVVEDVLSGDLSKMQWEELFATTQKGEKRVVSMLTIPLFEQDLIISTVMDITERHRMISRLKESEERYKAIFDRSFDCVCIYDLQGKFIDGNRAFFDLVEYTKEEILSMDPLEIIDPGSRKDFMKTRSALLKRGFDENLSEYRIMPKSRIPKIVEMRRSLILRNEAPYAIQSFIRDVTHERLLEEQVRHAQKMESIGTLAGGIAHDFNNILGIILGNAELSLEEIPEGFSSRLFLSEIRTACQRGRTVVSQLLGFSRHSEGKMKQIEILPVLQESVMALKQKASRGIDIVTQMQETIPPILGEELQIHQLLMNLFDNALEAMEGHGRIEIRVNNLSAGDLPEMPVPDMPSGNYVRIIIKDSGIGIPPEHIQRIFDPYFTTKEVGKGSGMGLSFVHGIMKSHHGYIRVESSPGKGTDFFLFFPALSRPEAKKKTSIKDLPGGKERILCVDDEEALLAIVEQMLERLGYAVEVQTDPAQAIQRFQSHPENYDLVITDLSMPDISGEDLAKEILAMRPDIPIILCTGYAGRADDQETKGTGISFILAKPFNHAGLASCVREVLDRKVTAS
jgi:PAS domain S-box-containing protein